MSGGQREMQRGWILKKLTLVALLAALPASMISLVFGDEPKLEKKSEQPAADQTIYELRIYTTLDGRLPALHARFKNHTIPLFEKHGMKNVAYWVPTDPEKSKNTLIYILEHKSLDAAKKSWNEFRNDPEWKKAQQESEKDGKIVAKVDYWYMTPAEYSPPLKK